MSAATGERSIHFLGSWPGANDAEAMHEMLSVTQDMGATVRSLPSGETRRPNWVIEDLELLENHPDIRVEKVSPESGRKPYDDYDTIPNFFVKEGHTFRSEEIELTYHEYTRDNWQHFDALRQEAGLPNLPYRVTFPGSLNPSMFAFGKQNPLKGFKYQAAFAEAYQREVDAIVRDPAIGRPDRSINDEIVWQIEVPAEVGGMSKPPTLLQPITNPLAADYFGRGIARQAEGLPEGSSGGAHPCPGDFHHTEFSALRNTDLLVSLSKAIIRHWPEGRKLDYIHFPMASGKRLPSTDPEYFKSLDQLAKVLPADTRFIAGFAHEGATPANQLVTRRIVEDILGRTVDIAYFCGLGRVSKETAIAVTRQCGELALTA